MADELVDIFDENYKCVGQELKSEARKHGHWVHSFHCWIVRPDVNGGYLQFQKRGADKDLFPNYLDISAAGHYRAGEKIENGVREIEEEIGIKVEIDELVSLGIKFDLAKINSIINRQFCHVFLLKSNIRAEDYSLDLEEVEGMVEISIIDGLNLFSGKVKEVQAIGIEYDSNKKLWNHVSLSVTRDGFIPRVDQYYYKMFILAKRFLDGEEHLAI